MCVVHTPLDLHQIIVSDRSQSFFCFCVMPSSTIVCQDCGAKTTSLWRRAHELNGWLCNACGCRHNRHMRGFKRLVAVSSALYQRHYARDHILTVRYVVNNDN